MRSEIRLKSPDPIKCQLLHYFPCFVTFDENSVLLLPNECEWIKVWQGVFWLRTVDEGNTYIIMTLYLLLLIKSFKLEIRFIDIQQDTLTFTDLIHVEQISKKVRSCFKDLEYGIHYQATSKMPRFLIHSKMHVKPFLKAKQDTC